MRIDRSPLCATRLAPGVRADDWGASARPAAPIVIAVISATQTVGRRRDVVTGARCAPPERAFRRFCRVVMVVLDRRTGVHDGSVTSPVERLSPCAPPVVHR